MTCDILLTTSLLISCNNLLQQADIRMRSDDLRHLVDDKSVASCQQTCCKLIVKSRAVHAEPELRCILLEPELENSSKNSGRQNYEKLILMQIAILPEFLRPFRSFENSVLLILLVLF